MSNKKKILILTREYSSKTRRNDRWTMIVSQFAKEWAKENDIIVVINSVRFPAFYYYLMGFAKTIVAKIYGKDASLLKDRSWGKTFDFADGDIKVYNLPKMKLYPHAKLFKWQLKKQAEQIEEILDKNQFTPDIIDAHWINPQLDLLLLLKVKYVGAKTTLVVHTEAIKKAYYTKEIRKGLNMLDHVGCRSRVGAESLFAGIGLNEKPFVCASGIPDEYFDVTANNKYINFMMPTISTVSRLLNWKCLDSTIKGVSEAFAGVDYHYNIYGEGSERDYLERVIRSRGLTERVHLRGKVSRDEVINQMQKTDIFVMISKHETFGLVYLEAMAQGCITIGSQNGGIDGIIVDGENGFLCPEGDGKSLSNLLRKIKDMSEEELQRISQNAKATAREYTDSKVAARYLAEISK